MVAQDPPQTEQGQQLLEQLTQAEQQDVVINAAETYNLAQDIDTNLAREVSQEVHNGFKDDDESRAEWLEQHTYWLSLYMQQDYAENSDPERYWGATESMPILSEAADQFQTRTYKSFFPNDTFISAIPMRRTSANQSDLEDRAERIGHHMSYQLGFKDRTYKKEKDALFLGTAVHGSFFTKTFPDIKKLCPKIINVRPTDLVVNYTVGSCRIEDLRRKTHIIYSTVGETQDLTNKGYFTQPAQPSHYEGKTPYNVKVDESQGLNSPSNNKLKRDRPAVLLEQHFYLDLDGNGEFKPYIATICAASKRLMRLTIGYEADQVGNPLKEYEQIQYFTHYKFKENPDGFYGLGLGHSIGDLNSAVNIMLRQSMDAATLANDGNMSGFISERLGIQSDDIRMVLGKLTKIPDTIGDFQNSIMLMKFPGPNEALMKIMEMLDSRAQRLGATTEATTGTPDAVTQPTTYLAEVEQAMETFSSVQMRLANSLSEELQKIYRINQRYMPLVDYYTVNDAPMMITRADYQDDMLIQPIFDPKFATQAQKVARAQAELQATIQNPNSQQRPQVFDEAYKRYFKALDVDNIDALIPPPPEPQDVDNQEWENMQFMLTPDKRTPFDVFPDQDHAKHLATLEGFVLQYGPMLTDPEQQQLIALHKRKHEAYFYGQQHGVLENSQAGQEPANALAGGLHNPMGNGAAPPNLPGLAALLSPQNMGGSTPASGTSSGNSAPPPIMQG